VKTLTLASCMLIGVFALEAQITAALRHLPQGLDEVRLRNDSTKVLVAYAVTVRQARTNSATSSAPLVVYSDPLINSSHQPLLPAQDRVVISRRLVSLPWAATGASPVKHFLEEPVAAAGIYADGTSTGDNGLVSRILIRRSNMLMAVETALEILLDSGRRNVPRDQLVEQFKRMADSVRRWYVPAEQQVAVDVYQPIIGRLINLPPQELGAPFPPTAFVDRETAGLNRQRVTLAESQPSLADHSLITTRQP